MLQTFEVVRGPSRPGISILGLNVAVSIWNLAWWFSLVWSGLNQYMLTETISELEFFYWTFLSRQRTCVFISKLWKGPEIFNYKLGLELDNDWRGCKVQPHRYWWKVPLFRVDLLNHLHVTTDFSCNFPIMCLWHPQFLVYLKLRILISELFMSSLKQLLWGLLDCHSWESHNLWYHFYKRWSYHMARSFHKVTLYKV